MTIEFKYRSAPVADVQAKLRDVVTWAEAGDVTAITTGQRVSAVIIPALYWERIAPEITLKQEAWPEDRAVTVRDRKVRGPGAVDLSGDEVKAVFLAMYGRGWEKTAAKVLGVELKAVRAYARRGAGFVPRAVSKRVKEVAAAAGWDWRRVV